jgi:prepilin-type processing-associated H-X9-DG protein
VLRRARNHARAVVCQTNLKQWGSALALYLEDNKGRLMGGLRADNFLFYGFRSEDDPNERRFLLPVDTKSIACCPMAPRKSARAGHIIGSTFGAWEQDGINPPYRGSYGYSDELFRGGFGYESSIRVRGHRIINVFSIKKRAQIPTILDSKLPFIWAHDHHGPPPSEDYALDFGVVCMNRHNGHINGLFLDWSVRKVGLKELWTLYWSPTFNRANEWTRAGGVKPEDWPEWMRNFKDY